MKTTLLFLSVFLSVNLFGQSTYGKWTNEDKRKCITDSENSMKGEDPINKSFNEVYNVNSIQLSNCKCDYLEKKRKDFESYDKDGRSDMVMNGELIYQAMKNCIDDESQIGNWSIKMRTFCPSIGMPDCVNKIMEAEYNNLFDAIRDFTIYPNKLEEYLKQCE